MNKNWLRKVIQDISTFGQIGFSIITPPVVLGLVFYFLDVKYNIGKLYIILAIIIGIITGLWAAFKIVIPVLSKATKEKEENSTINFNKHY